MVSNWQLNQKNDEYKLDIKFDKNMKENVCVKRFNGNGRYYIIYDMGDNEYIYYNDVGFLYKKNSFKMIEIKDNEKQGLLNNKLIFQLNSIHDISNRGNGGIVHIEDLHIRENVIDFLSGNNYDDYIEEYEED